MTAAPTPTSPASLKLQSRVLPLETGMYIVRYASDLPAGQEVFITLQQAPLGKGSVDFFPAEGVSRNTLAKLGDCVIVRVKGDIGALLVTEYHMAANAIRSVNLRVDRIDTSAAIMREPQQPAIAAEQQPQPKPRASIAAPAAQPTSQQPQAMAANGATAPPGVPLRLEGHIERRGDVAVEAGWWLGNPDSTARLEGFTIHWPSKPEGVDLAYSCQVLGGRQPAAMSGSFIGTRRRAAGITAITFGLIGPKQKQFQLAGQVVFSGSAPKAILNGQELSGPTGQEHLVAIQVSVSPKLEANAPRYTSPWEDPAITQIYRAQG